MQGETYYQVGFLGARISSHLHVMTVNVLMLVNHVWLVAISHALQVFPCDVLHIHIR